MPSRFRLEFQPFGGDEWHVPDRSTPVHFDDFEAAARAVAGRLRRYRALRPEQYRIVCLPNGQPVTSGDQCPDHLDGGRSTPAGDDLGSNPKQAFGDAKVPLHLVPAALMDAVGRGLSEGRDKYGAWNWRSTQVEAMTYVGAIMRHLMAYVDGEDLDPDSATGKSHLDGAAASLAILLDATHGGFLVDNRPPKGPGGALMRKPVKRVPKR